MPLQSMVLAVCGDGLQVLKLDAVNVGIGEATVNGLSASFYHHDKNHFVHLGLPARDDVGPMASSTRRSTTSLV